MGLPLPHAQPFPLARHRSELRDIGQVQLRNSMGPWVWAIREHGRVTHKDKMKLSAHHKDGEPMKGTQKLQENVTRLTCDPSTRGRLLPPCSNQGSSARLGHLGHGDNRNPEKALGEVDGLALAHQNCQLLSRAHSGIEVRKWIDPKGWPSPLQAHALAGVNAHSFISPFSPTTTLSISIILTHVLKRGCPISPDTS